MEADIELPSRILTAMERKWSGVDLDAPLSPYSGPGCFTVRDLIGTVVADVMMIVSGMVPIELWEEADRDA